MMSRLRAAGRVALRGVALAALTVGVTALGVVGGMFLMSPAVAPQQRLLVLGSVLGLLLFAAAGVWARGAWAVRRVTRARAEAAHVMPMARAGGAWSSAGRKQKTPQAVQALAARGAAPTEIAARTGLPLDAVSMVLALGAR